MKLIFATHNPGKIKEMRQLLADLKIEVMSAADAGFTESIIEDGTTFEENASKKAWEVAKTLNEWAVADDSGICIEALGCRPGVESARWAGQDVSDEEIIEHTLEETKHVPEAQRKAWFESAVALFAPDGRHWIFTGRIDGRIATAPRGTSRPKLPYDMIFIPEGGEKTFAEMSDEGKNAISHRGQAFKQLKEFLKDLEAK